MNPCYSTSIKHCAYGTVFYTVGRENRYGFVIERSEICFPCYSTIENTSLRWRIFYVRYVPATDDTLFFVRSGIMDVNMIYHLQGWNGECWAGNATVSGLAGRLAFGEEVLSSASYDVRRGYTLRCLAIE